MLKLIQIEFLKIRRKKVLWYMLLTSLIMPIYALSYFGYSDGKIIDTAEFYNLTALSFTITLILPFVLGMLSIMLMQDEKENSLLTQLWIVPVSKTGYFLSKFVIVFIYSIGFMIITASASILMYTLLGYGIIPWETIVRLFEESILASMLIAFAILPVLAMSTLFKGYIFSTCMVLSYSFVSLFIGTINMYLTPLSSATLIIVNPENLSTSQEIYSPYSLLCIAVWSIVAIISATASLKRK